MNLENISFEEFIELMIEKGWIPEERRKILSNFRGVIRCGRRPPPTPLEGSQTLFAPSAFQK